MGQNKVHGKNLLGEIASVKVWFFRHLRCRCPKIREDSSYLVLDKNGGDGGDDYNSKSGLVVKKKTLIIEWKREWRRRMKRFKRRSRKYCPE